MLSSAKALCSATGLEVVTPVTVGCLRILSSRYLKTQASQVSQSAPLASEELYEAHEQTLHAQESTTKTNPPPQLLFDDPKTAFEARSSWELLRSLAIFKLCTVKPFVVNADKLLATSKHIFGSTFVHSIVRHTFFKQFCAGENSESIQPTLHYLHKNGIKAILDYAAEDDVQSEAGPVSRTHPTATVVARTYDYSSEKKCDKHLSIFLKAIDAAARAEGQGFAAIKVTGLGNPLLLERVSSSLIAIRNLFRQFDEDHNGHITREEFTNVYSQLFNDSTPARMERVFRYLDTAQAGTIDYVSWSKQVRVQDVPEIVQRCRHQGAFARSALSSEELRLLDNMMVRVDVLAQAAAQANVRLMVDAEHSYFQPAIDNAVTQLQRTYNVQQPVIFNTYQAYLKDCNERLLIDLERARREGWRFGAKLVRGAYLVLERQRAQEMGYPSPVQETLEDTRASYDRCMHTLLTSVAADCSEVMVASHNQPSIERAVGLMAQLGLEPRSGVSFGQLLGMADHLTFVLGGNGYQAYKYVPFGPVELVMPYLVRRAQENSDLLGGVGHETDMIVAELFRRLVEENPIARLAAKG